MWLNSILDFVSSLVASLAWPVATVASIYIIRNKFFEWISHAKKIRFGDYEINLERKVEQVIVSAIDHGITVRRPPSESDQTTSDSDYRLYNFMLGWQQIEKMFLSYYTGDDNLVSRSKPAPALYELIEKSFKEKIIDKNLYSTLREMNKLRNFIAHDVTAIDTEEPHSRELMGLLQSVKERLTQAFKK